LGDTFASVNIAASNFTDKMYLQVEALFTLTACFSRSSKLLGMYVQIVISEHPSRKIIYTGG
jgi:hypothetical protein